MDVEEKDKEKVNDISQANKEDNECWDEIGSDGEHQAEEVPKEKTVVKEDVKKEPKKPILKDKHGEILINKLEAYIEPVKQVKEAKGDIRDENRYNFKALNINDHDNNEEEPEKDIEQEHEPEEEEEEEVHEKKRKKKPVQAKKVVQDDLDDILKEMGVEAKEEPKVVKEKKPKKKKPVEEQAKIEVQSEEKKDQTEEPKEEKADTKKKKKTVVQSTVKKSSHVNEVKREIIDRKEALKKKDKKKGMI